MVGFVASFFLHYAGFDLASIIGALTFSLLMIACPVWATAQDLVVSTHRFAEVL